MALNAPPNDLNNDPGTEEVPTTPETGAPETAEQAVNEAPATEEPVVEEAAPETAESGDAAVEETAAETAVEAVDSEPATEEEAAEETAEAEAPVAEAEEPKLKRGDIVSGTVVSRSPTEILIQLEDEMAGVITGRELARMDQSALDELPEGAEVLVYILNPSNRDGKAVLSLDRAMEEQDWRLAQEYLGNQSIYNGKVSGYNKGGLIVRFGRVRGFVPASQVSEERRQQATGSSPKDRWEDMINKEITVKVVEVDRQRNRLILSERAASKEVRDKRKAELLDTLKVGDVREGVVVSLTDFGAFVDLGGADGLIHLTEMSWKHITRPEEVLSIGQEVKVEVISLDSDRRRIGLSMKSQELDPWSEAVNNFRVGQLVKGKVTKLTKFGAFACLDTAPDIEGLIHISELSDHRVGHPREVVNEGDELTLRIVKIDRNQRRMGLSLKQVDRADYLELDLSTYEDGDEDAPLLEDVENGDA